MFKFCYNRLFRTILCLSLLSALIIFGNKNTLAASGNLIMSVRINDLHGGVYTYDSSVDPQIFGLTVSGSILLTTTGSTSFPDYFPANGILTKEI